MQTKQSFAAKATYWLKVVSLGLVLGLGLQFAQAWTAPTVAPPGGNVSGPVTLGVGAQYKAGKLGVNSNITPIGAFEVGSGGNALIGGKAYSASTIATDLGTTLATKDYVDGKVNENGVVGLPQMNSSVGSDVNYEEAWNYCMGLGSGWRPPSVNEVEMLRHFDNPLFDSLFKGNYAFWTTGTYNYGTNSRSAWHPNLNSGEQFCSISAASKVSNCQYGNWPMKVVCVK